LKDEEDIQINSIDDLEDSEVEETSTFSPAKVLSQINSPASGYSFAQVGSSILNEEESIDAELNNFNPKKALSTVSTPSTSSSTS